jgi:hypothetical protein
MRIVVCLVMLLCMAGCGSVQDLVQFARQTDQARKSLEQDFGEGVSLNANINNGVTSVTVTLPTGRIQGTTVGEIERKVKAQVATAMKRSHNLYILLEFPAK